MKINENMAFVGLVIMVITAISGAVIGLIKFCDAMFYYFNFFGIIPIAGFVGLTIFIIGIIWIELPRKVRFLR